MATSTTQNKWRRKNRLVKSQLNVMARKQTHEELEEFAATFQLLGKGEAVTFAAFLTKPVKKSVLFDCLRIVLGLKDDRSKDPAGQIVTSFTVEESRVGKEKTDRKLRILLAEDNMMNQKVAKNMLKKKN